MIHTYELPAKQRDFRCPCHRSWSEADTFVMRKDAEGYTICLCKQTRFRWQAAIQPHRPLAGHQRTTPGVGLATTTGDPGGL